MVPGKRGGLWRLSWSVVFCIAAGCGRKTESSLDEIPVGPPPTVIGDDRRPDLPDGSLTTDEYMRRGMPSPDRPWTGKDLSEAAKCLKDLTANSFELLPRYDSPRSHEIFSRITSVENLSFFSKKSLPVEMRSALSAAYLQGHNEITRIYAVAFVRYKHLDNEMVEVVTVGLRAAVVMIEIFTEHAAKLDKERPDDQTHKEGLKRMKQGLGNVVLGAIQMATELAPTAVGATDRLVAGMTETFPALVPHLSEGTSADVVRRLEALADNQFPDDVRAKLSDLAKRIRTERKNP